MSPQEYQDAQDQIVLVARMTMGIPIEELLQAIERADAVGPFVDPTAWRAGHEKMYRVRELARKMRAVQVEVQRQIVEETMEKERRRT